MSQSPVNLSQRLPHNWRIVWGLLIGLGLFLEVPRWMTAEGRAERLAGWLCGRSPDWLPITLWLLLAPLFVWLSQHVRPWRSSWLSGLRTWLNESAREREWDAGSLIVSVVLGVAAWLMSASIGSQLADLPPVYHDEYSYLIQAQTMRAGRTWYPVSASQPQLFDQIHVLNEPDLDPPTGRFASRYFPGTGLWMAPFVSGANVRLGHQLAQMLIVVGIYWIGRELGSNAVGVLAALLAMASPGLLLFSNLLLAHHPTLVGLTLFLWMYLRGRRTGSVWSCLLAGSGLAFATLCRPMTAAGFSLPLGLTFGWWWITGRGNWLVTAQPMKFAARTRYALALGGPLIAGILGLIWYQQSITGSPLVSPYQLYTDRYTPRHVYGFNNVVRGEQHLGPKVIDNYDTWAENLTPALAAKNVGTRLINSWKWSLGVLPLLGTSLILLLDRRGDPNWWILPGSILSLHIVHVPYWFEGIMGWHYVFETGPLWLLLCAMVLARIMSMPCLWWWSWGLLTLSLLLNVQTVSPIWPARVDVGMAELQYPAEHYAAFRQQIELLRQGEPVLVLVIADPDDRSMDYVTNSASLTDAVLVGRWRGESLADIQSAFPDRMLLQFDARTRQLLAP